MEEVQTTIPKDLEPTVQELLKLPAATRVELGEMLIASVPGFADSEIEQAWSEEISRRLRDYEEGRVTGIPAEEVLAGIRQKLAQRRPHKNE